MWMAGIQGYNRVRCLPFLPPETPDEDHMVSFLEDNEPALRNLSLKSTLNLKHGDYTDHYTHDGDIGGIHAC